MHRIVTNLAPAVAAVLALSGSAGAADIPIKGGCVLGESQLAHGLSAADAQARIIQYARDYVQNYSSYSNNKIETRRQTADYLERKKWTQDDVVGFTRKQRELLYISVAGELATGKIDTSELPGFVAAIDQKIRDIEAELGCDVMPAE